MSRVWQDLTLRKWAGHGHDKDQAQNPPAGSLVHFCAACPQAGVNMPENWEKEQNADYKFRKLVGMDGNFTAEHIHMNTPDDVNLQNGLGFFVEKKLNDDYLEKTPQSREVSEVSLHCQAK